MRFLRRFFARLRNLVTGGGDDGRLLEEMEDIWRSKRRKMSAPA